MKEKKQLKLFLLIAFALPYLMGILMGYGYSKGMDVSYFADAQMFYPAAGVMTAILVFQKEDPRVPRRFYICFITLTVIKAVVSVSSVIVPEMPIFVVLNYTMILGSLASWICLLSEKKEKRAAYGLRGAHAKASVFMVVLFLALYFGRIFLSALLSGTTGETLSIFTNPLFYSISLSFPIDFFMVFTAFLGEEYGWRYYFTPFLQGHFGKIKGVLLLGVLP